MSSYQKREWEPHREPRSRREEQQPGSEQSGQAHSWPIVSFSVTRDRAALCGPKRLWDISHKLHMTLRLTKRAAVQKKKGPLHTPSPHPRPKQSPLQLAWSSFTGQTAKLLMDMKRSVCSLFFMNVTVPNVAGWLPLGHSTLVLLSCLGVKSTAGLSAAC